MVVFGTANESTPLGLALGSRWRSRHVICRQRGKDLLVATIVMAHLLDDAAVEGVYEDLGAIAASGAGKVVVDFEQVKGISHTLLPLLHRLAQHVRERGGRLVLCGLAPALAEMFHLDTLARAGESSHAQLQLVPDAETAIARLSNP
jgi:anti-anti-sigma regulatory factor